MASVEAEGRSSTIAPGTEHHLPFVADLAERGDSPALFSDAATLTYEQLAARVDEVGDRLGPTRRLVLLSPRNDVSSVVTYLAARRGGHPVLLSPAGDRRRMAELIGAYDPDVVADHDGELRERRTGTTHELHPDLALLLSTSGSTGSPRLVRLSHANLQANADAIAEALDIRSTDRAVTTLPLHYCYGLSVVHSHLTRGAGLVLGDDSVVDPAYWDRFRRFGGSSLAGVPYTFELLEQVGLDRLELPSLRQVTQAGGRMSPDRVRRFALLGRRLGWDLVVMYGQTEATARMAVMPSDLAPEHPQSIGLPVPGGSFRIDAPDAEGRGELVYEGPNVMLGYAQHPSDLGAGRTITELRTGDIARRNEAGLYEIVGRSSRFLKLYGHRLELDRVEQVLAAHGHDVVCTGDDRQLVVATTRRAGRDGLQRLVTDRFGLPHRAVRVVVFDEIPRLATGKPDLPAIRRRASSPQVEAAPAPRLTDDAGGRVRAVLASVLAVADLPDDATFVGLGGDSLSYVEASIRLEAALGTLPADWHVRTIVELESLAPVRRVLPRMEVNVVLRALSIVMMVAGHVGVAPLRGGAHLLLAVAGFNFARFGLGARDAGEQVRRVRSNLARIAVPSLAFIGVTVALDERFTLANLVLVNHHVGTGEWRYWFIEVLVQVLVLLGGCFAVPRVLEAERRRPLLFALGLLAVALVAREALTDLGDPGYRTFTTQAAAWLFVLGWAVQRAVTVPQRLLVTAVTLVSVPGFFQVQWRGEIVLAGILVLIWVRSIPVPSVANRALGVVAGASLYIYLSHWHVYRELDRAAGPIVAIVGSLALGIVLWKAAEGIRNARRRRSGTSVGWAARTA